jgi:hypothetical protein
MSKLRARRFSENKIAAHASTIAAGVQKGYIWIASNAENGIKTPQKPLKLIYYNERISIKLLAL